MPTKTHDSSMGARGEWSTIQSQPQKWYSVKRQMRSITNMLSTFNQSMSGELKALEFHNYYNDHSEGWRVRKCTVVRQTLCSASSAISGDAAEGGGGCKDIQYLYSDTLSNVQDGEIWGQNPHPDVCGLETI